MASRVLPVSEAPRKTRHGGPQSTQERETAHIM